MYQYDFVKTRGKDKTPRKREIKTDRSLTISSSSGHTKDVPFIRLNGLWLEDLGFHIGDKVSVHCENDKLVITKLKDQ